ncbi:MAG: acetyl/propionyl/methylcrotonyl-CoA carboxylase subunit alpha [Rhodospirillales bacterium]|nr:acetyl/propionyl/methylcrotonyl-CoA carboxylase subunit alpha [Rhodospirillales bacterium]
MFKKILISNRGEIACRIIRTARRMGIPTVAVYSDADVDSLHARLADEKVCIGPAPSSESYLSVDNILSAIRETGADAVHPGYGFLSENAEFARALKKAGVAFIGPGEKAVTAMGDKIESKKLADKAGVSTIPGHPEALKDGAEALRISKKIGYPVMLKASAGGGGKGMRIARTDDEVKEGFASAVREAKSSFGDDRVFVEKYIESPRHIEIQVLADAHGNTVYLGERECSIQRRHQKVIEECPSPFLDAATRKAMGEQAVRLAKAVDYVSAGTVEFIVDAKRNFYFLEMNTRLQVEHPVTEMVTGLDLVELMIRAAAGEKLPIAQKDVKLKGWAVETRIYAEDPFRNFLPSIGRLVRYAAPEESNHVRVDSGVDEGGEISIYYDPMIAKLITYGETRNAAIGHMQGALDSFYIRGVSHNIGFLAAVIAHPRFMEGRLSTGFIDEEYPDGFHPEDVPHDDPVLLIAVAAVIHHAYQARAAMISGQSSGMERKVSDDWVVVLKNESFPVTVRTVADGYEVTAGNAELTVRTGWTLGDPLFRATVGDRSLTIQVKRLTVGYRLVHCGLTAMVKVLSPHVAKFNALMPVKLPPDLSRFLLSPMPGLLLSVSASAGQEVKAGDELAVVEAMKMENVLRAEQDGVIKAVHAGPGDSLSVDQSILEFE